MPVMPAGLTAAVLLLAQAASAAPATDIPVYGPAAPAAPKKPAPPRPDPACERPSVTAESQHIVVCAVRPEGYRLNPDVMQARREIRSGGRPTRPGPTGAVPNNCTIGPAGCGPQAGINLVAAAVTAATMARRLAEGREIGSMFVTDPHPSEYQLYLEAKRRREANDAGRAAATLAKAREAEATESAAGLAQ